MSIKKFDDNFNAIVKSLKPIKYKYSKESLKHDEYFKKSGLEILEKNLNAPKKPPDNFYSSKLYKNLDYIYNLSDAPFDYAPNLKGEINIPINIRKKGVNFIKNLYNPEFEEKREENYFLYDNNKKRNYNRFNIKQLNKSKNIFKFKILALDPGYYHPNYNYIKKRIPSIDFSKSTNSHEKNDLAKIFEENKDYIEPKNINISTIKENINDNVMKNYESEMENDKLYIIKKDISRNNVIDNLDYEAQTVLPIINGKEKEKEVKKNFFIKKIPYSKSQKMIPKKGTISFKKMMGRYPTKKIFKKIDKIDNEYEPNYDFTLPHVRSFMFKSNGNEKNYKKYVIGKILRSYYYNPNGYFVMDINKSNISG
jgi:hypothetical protein